MVQEVTAIRLRFGDAMDTRRASKTEKRSAKVWLENSPEGWHIARHWLEGDTYKETRSFHLDFLLCSIEACLVLINLDAIG